MSLKIKIILSITVATIILFSGYILINKNLKQNISSTPTPAIQTSNSSVVKPIILASEKIINFAFKPVFDNQNRISGYDIQMDPSDQEKITPDVVFFDKVYTDTCAIAFKPKFNMEDFNNFKVISINIKGSDYNYESLYSDYTDFKNNYPDGNVSQIYFDIFYKDEAAQKLSNSQNKGSDITINCNITTVIDGKPQGGFTISEDGKAQKWGVIYSDYESTIKARNWNNPESFKQLFDKRYYFAKKS